MGSIAALVGLLHAALLTASFGARSSSQPAALRTSAPPPAPVATKTTVARAPERKPHVRKHRNKHQRQRRHSRHAPAKPAHSTPTLAQAQTPVVTQTEPQAVSQPTETVASPAPAPKPVKQLSRPKRSSPGGTSFDDSG